MRTRGTLALPLLTSICLGLPAMAQQQPPAATGVQPTETPSSAPATSNKRAECRQKLRQQGLRGADLRDQFQLCLADARKDCLKDAINQKITGGQRKEFVKNCMGGKS
jgi:hypothetical protein